MDLTPIAVTAIIFIAVYKIIELFVRRNERLKLIDKLTELPPAVLADKLPGLQNMANILTSGIAPDSRFSALKWGGFAFGVGVGCIISSVMGYSYVGEWFNRLNFQSGCVLTCGGAGLLIAFIIEYMMRKHDQQQKQQ